MIPFSPELRCMLISDIVNELEAWASPALQESYDNAGLIVGDPQAPCTGIICALDATEAVVDEAAAAGANLIVAHHPIVFSGIKKLTGKNYVERTVINAIRQGVAIYACHTNLDNLVEGVNRQIAVKIGLMNGRILAPKPGTLRKMATFVPVAYAEQVRKAMFDAGAGEIGQYSSCSFNTEGVGTFLAGSDTQPFVGERGQLHREPELKVEMVYPFFREGAVLRAMRAAHPYEEVAFDIFPLSNSHPGIGAGLIGQLPEPLEVHDFMALLAEKFNQPVVRHTAPTERPIQTVAICGGAGSFLISNAIAQGADAFVTADLKYHEFFDADGRLLLADIGHYESEQFTIGLLQEFLLQKFPTFAVLKTKVETNPVHYFTSQLAARNR